MGILEFFGLGNNDPDPAPVDPDPAPVDPDPAPVDPDPAPVDPDPAPVDPDPAPVDPDPAPVDPDPAPVDPDPAPVDPDPAPVDPDPAPVDPDPAPVEPSEVHTALHAALVKLDGRLSDPNALAYDEAHLTDAEALSAAIGALIERSPHLSATAVAGDVGQGDRGGAPAPFDLIATMRQAHGIT